MEKLKEKIKKLENKLPEEMNLIIDTFEDGCYLVGIYRGQFTPYTRKWKYNATEEEKLKLQIKCLKDFFKFWYTEKK